MMMILMIEYDALPWTKATKQYIKELTVEMNVAGLLIKNIRYDTKY